MCFRTEKLYKRNKHQCIRGTKHICLQRNGTDQLSNIMCRSDVLELLHLGRWPPALLPQPPLLDEPLAPLPQLLGHLHPCPLLQDHLLLGLERHVLDRSRWFWLLWLLRRISCTSLCRGVDNYGHLLGKRNMAD